VLVEGDLEVGANAYVIDSLFLDAKAAATTDVTSVGQLWVKNATPCELWFTRDNGADVSIA